MTNEEENNQVTISNIIVGLNVVNSDGDTGVIKDYDEELHNVFVLYDNGGIGFCCLNKDCIEEIDINGEKIESTQYDPLYIY